MQGSNKRDRLRYSVAVSIKRAENHNSKFKPWSFAKMWRMLHCPEAMALYSELDRINQTGEQE